MSETFQRRKLTRSKNNNNFSASCNLIAQYNPLLSNIKTIFKTHLPVLNSSQEMIQIANVTYRRNIKLKRAHPIFIS